MPNTHPFQACNRPGGAGCVHRNLFDRDVFSGKTRRYRMLASKKKKIMQVNSFVLVHTPTTLLLELPAPQPTQCTNLKQCTTPATSTHPHKHCHTQSWFEISSGLLAHRPLCFTWSQLGTRPRLYYSQNVHPGATTGRNDHASQTAAPALRAILRLW